VKPRAGWKTAYGNEIQRAQAARLVGNEGMARVCARRAMGIVIGEYLYRRGYKELSTSVYDRLQLFGSLPDVDETLKATTRHFLLKVDHNRRLPGDVDLISEVETLARILLLENTN